jgi:hypothetical protein
MQITLATQIASSFGALLILIAYVGHQFHWMDSGKPLYNILNAAGSAVLAYIAMRPFQAGFLVMEVAWVIVSLYALTKSLRGSSPQARA